MKIYTGNFANVKKYRAANFTPISIARFSRYFVGEKMLNLAPSPEMLKMNYKDYLANFRPILTKLNPNDILKEIESLSENKDVVLCCFEKAEDFCHRHLVSAWLNKFLDYKIIELGTMQIEQTVEIEEISDTEIQIKQLFYK